MKVLVTGAGGFLGKHLVAELAAAGTTVVPLARVPSGRVPQADALVHLAFPTDPDERHAQSEVTVGAALAAASAAVVGAATRAGARHVLLASSGKVYGPPRTLPIGEAHPRTPDTGLGRLKALQEDALAYGAERSSAFGLTLLRVFNAYGEGQREPFVVAKICAALRASGTIRLGELDHRRDFVHVRDVARAFAVTLAAPPPVGEARILNVGSGRAASVREVLALLQCASGRRLRVERDPALLRPDEPPEERADWTRLAAFGWRPEVTLEDGLRALGAASRRDASAA